MPLGTNSVLDSIVHPDLHRSIQRVYPSYVEVQEAVETQGDDFAIVETWTAVPQLVGLRGILAEASATGANEIRLAQLTNVTITHVLDLQSYHPEIQETQRVLVSRAQGETAVIYNISGVKHDSQARSSRLELEKVSH